MFTTSNEYVWSIIVLIFMHGLKSAISAFMKNCQYDEAFLNQNALTLTTFVSDHDSSTPEEKFLRNLYESGP